MKQRFENNKLFDGKYSKFTVYDEPKLVQKMELANNY